MKKEAPKFFKSRISQVAKILCAPMFAERVGDFGAAIIQLERLRPESATHSGDALSR